MRWAWLIVAMGCFSPTFPEGRPCAADLACPGDLICDPATTTCLEEASAPVPDASVDAVPDAAIDAGAKPCIEGTVRAQDPNTGNCYVHLSDPTAWTDGAASCESLGADFHLASITSADENAFVQSFVPATISWIGANDQVAEGTFEWTTGELFEFDNWRAGEPNNALGVEDCATFASNQGGVWDDRPCNNLHAIVCERDG